MTARVAVVPVAGRATRMRPASRSVPKALLPLADRPVIQWVLEEGLRAGVEEFAVVVSPGQEDLLRRHFAGGEDLLPLEGFERAVLHWVTQPKARGLGDAVLQARTVVGDRPFFCLLGDGLVLPGGDQLTALAAVADGRSVICLRPLPEEALDRYGVAVVGESLGDRVIALAGAVEKPGRDQAPSHLGFVGRYLFTPEVFDSLAHLSPSVGGEIQLTDAIDDLGRRGRCLGWIAEEDLLDVGNPAGYLEAFAALSLLHPQLGEGFRQHLGTLLAGNEGSGR